MSSPFDPGSVDSGTRSERFHATVPAEFQTRPRTRRPIRWFIVLALAAGALWWFVGEKPFLPEQAANEEYPFFEILIMRYVRGVLDEIGPHSSTESWQSFSRYHSKLIVSPFVLNAALRKPDIAKIDLVRRQEHPIDWLEKHLTVTFPEGEIMRVTLRETRSADTVDLLNAIADSYLKEAESSLQIGRKNRFESVERMIDETEKNAAMKKAALKKLVSMSMPDTSQYERDLASAILLERTQARSRVWTCKSELTQAEAALTVANGPEAVVSESDVEAELNREEELYYSRNHKYQLDQLIADVGSGNPSKEATLTKYRERMAVAQQLLDVHLQEVRPRVIERLRKRIKIAALANVAASTQRLALAEAESNRFDSVPPPQLKQEQIDVTGLEDDVRLQTDILQQLKRRRELLRIEMEAPSGVALFRRAEQ